MKKILYVCIFALFLNSCEKSEDKGYLVIKVLDEETNEPIENVEIRVDRWKNEFLIFGGPNIIDIQINITNNDGIVKCYYGNFDLIYNYSIYAKYKGHNLYRQQIVYGLDAKKIQVIKLYVKDIIEYNK